MLLMKGVPPKASRPMNVTLLGMLTDDSSVHQSICKSFTINYLHIKR